MGYQFATLSDVRRIVAAVLASEQRLQNRTQRKGRWHMPAPLEAYLGKADAAIAARSGTTPGSGTVSLFKIDDSGDLADTGEDVTAYNVAGGAVTSGAYVMLKREPYSGKWLVDFEDCG